MRNTCKSRLKDKRGKIRKASQSGKKALALAGAVAREARAARQKVVSGIPTA